MIMVNLLEIRTAEKIEAKSGHNKYITIYFRSGSKSPYWIKMDL